MILNRDNWVERSVRLSFGPATIVVDRLTGKIMKAAYGVQHPRPDGRWPELTAPDVELPRIP